MWIYYSYLSVLPFFIIAPLISCLSQIIDGAVVIHFCNGTACHCSVFSVQCSVFSVYAHFSKQTNIVRKAFSENGQLKTYSKGTECSRAVAEKTRKKFVTPYPFFGVKCCAGITSTYKEKLRCLKEHQSLVPFSSPCLFFTCFADLVLGKICYDFLLLYSLPINHKRG